MMRTAQLDNPAVPPTSSVVLGTWADRVQAEYATGAAATQLALWLMQIGASPDLIVAGLRAAEEEIDHAARSFEICKLAGLSSPRVIPRESLGLPRNPAAPLEHDIVRGCLRVFCVGETYAVEILREMREVCTFDPAAAVIDTLLADEVNHRHYGFDVLRWMLEHHDDSRTLIRLVREELPQILEDLRATFGRDAGPHVGPVENAWGVLSWQRYAEVLDRVCASALPHHFRRACPGEGLFDRPTIETGAA